MSWHFLPELVADCSGRDCSGGEPCAPSSVTLIAERCFSDASGTVCSTCSPSGMTCGHSTAGRGVVSWMLSLAASRASHSPSLGSSGANRTSEICGPTQRESLAKYDPASRSWRTSQGYLLTGTSDEYLATWPNWGSVCRGVFSMRAPMERHTHEPDCFYAPTPTATDHKGGGRAERSARVGRNERNNLRDWFSLRYGLLYPPVEVVEWLMGWPIGHTGLERQATDRFQAWLDAHGKFSVDSLAVGGDL